MIKQLKDLRSFVKEDKVAVERVDYLIRLAQQKGVHKLGTGMVIDYNPTSPATITIKWAPYGSKWKQGDQIMQGEDGFSEIFSMIGK